MERKTGGKALRVLTWQRGSANNRWMQNAFPLPGINWLETTATVDASGFPAVLNSQVYDWWKVKYTGGGLVSFDALKIAAKDDPGFGRIDARLTNQGGCAPAGTTPTNTYSACNATEPQGDLLPLPPYATGIPTHCKPYTIEPHNGIALWNAILRTGIYGVGYPPVFCWYMTLDAYAKGVAPYWNDYLSRPMQTPGC